MTLNVFNDLEFESVVRELDTPDVEGWEFFTESHGVKIYRLYNENEATRTVRVSGSETTIRTITIEENSSTIEITLWRELAELAINIGDTLQITHCLLNEWQGTKALNTTRNTTIQTSGLYEYKVYGTLDDCPPDVCSEVYLDLEYRKKWDSYVAELYEREANGMKVIYWDVAYPFPMSHRDYVYKREYKELEHNGQKVYAVMAKSVECSEIPEKSGVIRVDDYKQSCVLTTDGKVGSKAFMRYYDNPKGMIPTWLINWGAKTGVPSFLTMMQKACRTYPEYKAKRMAASS